MYSPICIASMYTMHGRGIKKYSFATMPSQVFVIKQTSQTIIINRI